MKLLQFDKMFVPCTFYQVGCFALFSVHFGIAFSFPFLFLCFFLWSLFKLILKVSETSCTDSGCIGLQVTLKDSMLHSMAEKKKRKKKTTGTQSTIFWKQGFERQLINLFFLLTLVVKLVKNSHLKMQRMAHQNFW